MGDESMRGAHAVEGGLPTPTSPWPTFDRPYRAVVWGLWLFLLFCIPVTSAPQVAAVLGENPVSPLAFIPLAGIGLLWFVPYLARGGRLPASSWPLLAFVALAVLSALAATALPIFPYKNQDMVSRELRALVTIALGLLFYWTAAILPRTDDEFVVSLRAVNIGGVVMLAWSTVQAWVMLSGRTHVPLWVTNVHHLFSIRDPLLDRVTGMTFEPSWLGDQLVILYIPLWLTAVLRRMSSFSKSKTLFSVELGLFVWGIGILLLSKSRISLLSLLIVGGVLYAIASWRATGWLARRAAATYRVFMSEGRARALHVILEIALLCALVAIGVAGTFVAGKADRRLRQLSTLPDLLKEIRRFYPNDVAYEVANRLAFAERVVYWADGFRVFEQHPVLGVGPGNAGFFFAQSMPVYGYRLEEIRQILVPANAPFPNPKNLWVRLLAETGLAGFSAFGLWLGLMGLSAWEVWRIGSPVRRMIGLAALFALLAQIGEGFSLDSFALPQLWVILGLLTAAAWHEA
jgi:O-antigen ligase